MQQTYGVQDWVSRISQGELATLSGVVRHLQSIVNDDEVSLYEVSQVVLSDPTMTSRVLRIANSASYNPAGVSISTVSRATVILGVSAIRSICISVKIIDNLLSRHKHERLFRTLARCLHTAVLARRLWTRWRPTQAEEVFISALLLNLGEAVFWSLGDPAGARIEELLFAGRTMEEASSEVLGLTFSALGLELAKAWLLGELTQQVMSRTGGLSDASDVVLACDGLVKVWTEGNPDLRDGFYADLARLLKTDKEHVRQESEEAVSLLMEVADEFGVPELKPYLPSSARQAVGKPSLQPVRADPTLQLSILREMCLAVGEKANINTLVTMALEGLHRGVGLDRVVVAILSPDGKSCVARAAIGRVLPEWRDRFQFNLAAGDVPLIAAILQSGEARWIGQGGAVDISKLGKGGERLLLRAGQKIEAFVAPLCVNGKAIGFFYADCLPSGRVMQEADFAAFRHFTQQVTLSLSTARA